MEMVENQQKNISNRSTRSVGIANDNLKDDFDIRDIQCCPLSELDDAPNSIMLLLHHVVALSFFCYVAIIKNKSEQFAVALRFRNDMARGWEGYHRDSNPDVVPYSVLKPGEIRVIYLSLLTKNTGRFTFMRKDGKVDMKWNLTTTVNSICFTKGWPLVLTVTCPNSDDESARHLPKWVGYNSWLTRILRPVSDSTITARNENYTEETFQCEFLEKRSDPAVISLIEHLDVYYSEIALTYLTAISFFAVATTVDLLFAISMALITWLLMLLNAARKPISISFHDIGDYRSLEEFDCLEDAALYCAPMLLSGIGSIALSQVLSQDNPPFVSLIAVSLGLGYLLFFASVITLNLYKQICCRFNEMKSNIGLPCKALLFFTLSSIFYGVAALIVYFGFNPYPGMPALTGVSTLLIVNFVLGLKGYLLPYAFSNLGLLGLPVKAFSWIKKVDLANLMGFIKAYLIKLREAVRKNAVVIYITVHLLLGVVILWILVTTFRSIDFSLNQQTAI